MVVHGSRPVHPVVVCSNRSNYKLYAVYACSYMMCVKKKMHATYGSDIYTTHCDIYITGRVHVQVVRPRSRPPAGGPCGPTNKIQLQVVRICKPIEVPDATQTNARAQ